MKLANDYSLKYFLKFCYFIICPLWKTIIFNPIFPPLKITFNSIIEHQNDDFRFRLMPNDDEKISFIFHRYINSLMRWNPFSGSLNLIHLLIGQKFCYTISPKFIIFIILNAENFIRLNQEKKIISVKLENVPKRKVSQKPLEKRFFAFFDFQRFLSFLYATRKFF